MGLEVFSHFAQIYLTSPTCNPKQPYLAETHFEILPISSRYLMYLNVTIGVRQIREFRSSNLHP